MEKQFAPKYYGVTPEQHSSSFIQLGIYKKCELPDITRTSIQRPTQAIQSLEHENQGETYYGPNLQLRSKIDRYGTI